MNPSSHYSGRNERNSTRHEPSYQSASQSSWTQPRSYQLRDQRPYAPPSPPVDEGNKCSLPPIRDLLSFAGSTPPTWAPASRPLQQSTWQDDILSRQTFRPQVSTGAANARSTPPPAIQTTWTSSLATPAYNFPTQVDPALANHSLEANGRRRSFASTNSASSAQTSMSYSTASTSAPGSSPGSLAIPAASYHNAPIFTYQPAPPHPKRVLSLDDPAQNQRQQQPLALRSPSATSTETSPTSPTTTSDSWRQTTHYTHRPSSSSTSSGHTPSATFPQDRYICPTCAKAFSRPSSLKIHSHSHSGEKPFRCPQSGCGKAFSVRSNMKRHEKNCQKTTERIGDTTMREILPAAA